ncbi:hypothetical protein J7337_005101 [Fusarium musae]|uniref:Protein kinase domain-containing protein n=1 Tax=Fusarium musae TaxID=1042133 RepID=A0A9P8DI16_9HYPO|nr:hypothetical protein J7337_005101 [Fusarium musae]KAG9502274.1 hypothetical protein J7337_005101 [Fusarium musae]
MPQLKPLPDCQGPKLECFIDDIAACNFKLIERLGSGCHSQVWKAEINGKVYAIKLFFSLWAHEPNFIMDPIDDFTHDLDDGYEPPEEMSRMSQSTIASLRLHATSFYNECRVFGRLKELGRENLAVKSYGYLQFDLSDEKVQRHFLPFGNGARRTLAFRGNKEPTDEDVIRCLMQHDDLGIPMMAIVKEWVPSSEGPKLVRDVPEGRKYWLPAGEDRAVVKRSIGHLPRLLRNLRELHKSGIVIRDLKEQQYLDGQLVDFSFAWTIPHILGPESGLRPPWSFESMAAWDLECFQTILNDFDKKAERAVPRIRKHNLVARQSDDMYQRLRPRPQLYGPVLPMLVYDAKTKPMVHRPPFDPAKFNWRAVQKPTKKVATGRVTRTKAPQRRALREAPKKRGTR